MKCPIRRWVFDVKTQQLIPEQLDCLKEECAWWDDLPQRCALLSIAAKLTSIEGNIRGKK